MLLSLKALLKVVLLFKNKLEAKVLAALVEMLFSVRLLIFVDAYILHPFLQ